MKLGRKLAIGTAALAISALPFSLESIAFGSIEPAAALAKGGNGGGNGGENGGGNGNGKGGGDHGRSGEAHGKSGGARSGPFSPAGLFKGLFSSESRGTRTRASGNVKAAKAATKPSRTERLAVLPETVPIPTAKPEDKNLHAKLAGLNSLQRNYHAYLNSQSPRFAGIFDYVLDSAEGVIGVDDEVLREALLAAANENRVAQYGDDYLDDEVMDWSEDVLGVDDADGKIDEVRESFEADVE